MSVDSLNERATKTRGVVVIGRNEGERLRRCLSSVVKLSSCTVYVDSGSDDDSLAVARACGAEVVELNLDTPFTAARARNAGFERLMQKTSGLDYVFFVDGDCEIVPGWLDKATQFLSEHPGHAIVSGLRRERFPEKSIYNLIIDIEWRDYPFGEAKICGGDALMRVDAFKQVGGYRQELICGEEPEMCVRLRQVGWRIYRLNELMAMHDAAIYRFSQWWTREKRTGYAFAQGASLHGAAPERHSVAEARRAWLWGLIMPVVILLSIPVGGWWSLLLFAIYPLQVVRIGLKGTRKPRENWTRAVALTLGKFPQMLGQIKYLAIRMRGAQAQLIEYK